MPVRQLRSWPVLTGLLCAWMATAWVLWLVSGWRGDIMAGHSADIVVERAAVLVLALVPSVIAAVRQARPGMQAGLPIAMAPLVLGLLPVLAIASVQVRGELAGALPELGGIGRCVGLAIGCAVPTFVVLIVWARRWGAVTDPKQASLAIGLAAAVSGVAIYSLTCPSQHWLFAGINYPLAIATILLLSRMLLPRLLRW